MAINQNNKCGMADIYAGNTEYNAANQQIKKALDNLNTAFLARIDSCASSGEGGAKTVNATPLVAQIDAAGTAQSTPSYQALPHYRVQAGIAAIIIDPTPGDIGIFVTQNRDGSGINADSSAPQVPGSYRQHSPADAVMVGTVHTKTPEVWIELTQDKKVIIHAPAGVKIESDSTVEIDAAQVTINAPVQVNSTITASGDVSGGGVSLDTHTHSGVESGGSNTGRPN